MEMTKGRLLAGAAAQLMAQALTGWSVLAHIAGWPDISIWVVVPLVAAMLVPFRHNGSIRDRATTNFAASVVIAGVMWWEVAFGGLDGILGGGGFSFGAVGGLTLVATVLFTLAGGLFWLMREQGRS